MPIDAVIYDIGNVLLEWNPERFYDSRIGAERRRALFREVDLAGMNDRVDAGAPFREAVHALARAHPGWATQIRCWHDDWLAMASPDIPASAALLRALRSKGIPVFALTNFGIESYAMAQARYPVLTEFDREFVSGRLGVIKPDPAIYAILEAETGLPPGNLLFTDDKPENIAAAGARGWRTHLFEGPRGWADRLVAEGLLSGAEAA